MACFIFFIIGLLWLFQVVLLDSFYREIKFGRVTKLSDLIVYKLENCENIDSVSNSIEDDLKKRALNHESNIYLFYKDADENYCTRFSIIGFGAYPLATDPKVIKEMWEKAKSSNLNEFMFDTSQIERSDYEDDDGFFHQGSIIVYGKFAHFKDGQEVLLIVNTQLLPVNVAKETLKIQLIFICFILLLFGSIIALIISRFISTPLAKLNNAAKQLPNGKYDVDFEESGYLEVEELSETLNYASKEIRKSEELQRDLIANVSHELRTPLTLITGYSEMIRDIPSENTPENINIIIDETKRLSSLVSDILELSKLQSRVEKIDLEVVNLTELINNTLKRFNSYTENQKYDISFDYDQDVHIKANQKQIVQVMYNFIANAINYSKDTEDLKWIKITQEIIGNQVKITIKDNGIGIKEENLDNIWNRYYKLYDSQKKKSVGSGLGLSIVKEILEVHEFTYGVKSEYTVGSEFYFIAPRIICDIEDDKNA